MLSNSTIRSRANQLQWDYLLKLTTAETWNKTRVKVNVSWRPYLAGASLRRMTCYTLTWTSTNDSSIQISYRMQGEEFIEAWKLQGFACQFCSFDWIGCTSLLIVTSFLLFSFTFFHVHFFVIWNEHIYMVIFVFALFSFTLFYCELPMFIVCDVLMQLFTSFVFIYLFISGSSSALVFWKMDSDNMLKGLSVIYHTVSDLTGWMTLLFVNKDSIMLSSKLTSFLFRCN